MVDQDLTEKQVTSLRALFANPDTDRLIDFLAEHQIVPEDLVRGPEFKRRAKAVSELESMLGKDLAEPNWQQWFKENDWILGSDFVQILDEREIDVDHIADFLMKAYDGFLDLIEIKRPEGRMKFWADALDHGNYVPHSDLTKAITQAQRYIFEVEREANSIKTMRRLQGVGAVKPRCVLIYGRSDDWNEDQAEAYRILNSGYHNLSILTYDHVLERARRIAGLESPTTGRDADNRDHDVPF